MAKRRRKRKGAPARRLPWWLAAGAFLACLGTGALWWWGGRREPRQTPVAAPTPAAERIGKAERGALERLLREVEGRREGHPARSPAAPQ